jgi:hypothetical protein
VIQIQSENPSKLTPPRLVIEYETKTSAAWTNDSSSSDLLLFKVDYSMKTDSFWDSIQILIGFGAAFAVVVYGVKMNNWQSRLKEQALTLSSMTFIIHATMTLCHTFVLVFFPFAVAICAYW